MLIDKGFKVDINRLHVAINIQLTVIAMYNIDEIVRLVLNEIELQSRPQSDLAITDPLNVSYVKGKTTFKAADSNKLNGQLGAFYAPDSELKAIRETDLSAYLDQKMTQI